MLDKAIEKIKTEMEGNKDNLYIQVVGEYLLQQLKVNPAAAEKIMAEGKTVGQSLGEMRKAAEKKKNGNCAVLTNQEGFEVVLKYFGVEVAVNSAPSVVPVEPVPVPENKAVEFDVRLEDLL